VITHDESFLALLGRSDLADSYWRVEKDDQGFSKFSLHAIDGNQPRDDDYPEMGDIESFERSSSKSKYK
jgi:hypothetical protein